MAEIHFFAAPPDLEQIVTLLVERHDARFVLDAGPTAQLRVHRTVSEVMHAVAESQHDPRFFVLSPKWQRHDLLVDETIHNDGRRAFYVRQRYGGPAFDFIARRPRTRDSLPCLVASSLADYPWYYARASAPDTMPRPGPMARAFADVKRLISKEGVRSTTGESGKLGPWILQDALQGQRDGLWLRIGDWHYVPRKR
jgi:hypothetical protein